MGIESNRIESHNYLQYEQIVKEKMTSGMGNWKDGTSVMWGITASAYCPPSLGIIILGMLATIHTSEVEVKSGNTGASHLPLSDSDNSVFSYNESLFQ